MPTCRKCAREIPDGAPFCPWCGTEQKKKKQTGKKRANGTGSCRKRGSTWTSISPPRPVYVNGKIVYPVIKQLFNAADSGSTYARYILCGCYLGFRPTALFQLKKADYSAKDRTLTGSIKTPAGKNRVVPINAQIQPYIDDQMQTAGEWLFPNPSGGQFTSDNFRKDYFYRCMADLGIQPLPDEDHPPQYTPYSWRHTFFTLLRDVDGAEKTKAELGGHTSYEMSKHYQHADLDDKRKIIEKMLSLIVHNRVHNPSIFYVFLRLLLS